MRPSDAPSAARDISTNQQLRHLSAGSRGAGFQPAPAAWKAAAHEILLDASTLEVTVFSHSSRDSSILNPLQKLREFLPPLISYPGAGRT